MFCLPVAEEKTGKYKTEEGCLDGTEEEAEGEWIRAELLRGGTVKPQFALLPTVKTLKGDTEPLTLKAGGATVSCLEGSNTGEVTGMDTIGKMVLKFTGCKVAGTGGTECTLKSVGAAEEGEIVTTTLKAELGTTKATEATSEVGLLLEPETTKKIATLAETSCEPETFVTGSVAGEVAEVYAPQPTSEIIYGLTSGKQDIKKITVLSGEKDPELIAYTFDASLETSTMLAFNGSVEIS